MSLSAPLKVPQFRVHKGSGQGYANAWGRRIYFGKHDLPDAMRRYHEFVAEYMANGGQPPVQPDQMTIKELIARFWVHAEGYYLDAAGNPSTEIEAFRYALKPLKELFAESQVSDFGPRALQAVRHRMIEYGWCRTYINKHIVRVKSVFRWAAEQADNPDAADLIKIVVRESKRLSKTLDDFLEYARPGDLELEEVDLEQLVRETVALLRNSDELRPDHAIEVETEGEALFATVDPSQIKQVFWNLARNAIQAMPTGGLLRVVLSRADDRIEVCFADEGTGMEPGEVETFFQPYVSGRSGGTGLGLSIVYKVLERHGAAIEVDSEPGEGTRIRMSFKASLSEPGAGGQA